MSEAATEVRKPKRVATWKIVLVFLGALAVLLIVAVLWISAVGSRRWAAMEKTVRELHAETVARDASRPALRGVAVAGNGWDDYAIALKAMDAAKGSEAVLGEFVSRGPKADRAKVEAVLAAHGAALEPLRRGAARTHARYPIVWQEGFSANVPGLLQAQKLANLAVCRSRFLVEEGKPREAAELLLDTCQFGRDMGINQVLISEMIALAIYGVALDELRDLVLSAKLSREDLLAVAAELEQLDRTFPPHGFSMMNEALMAGWGFIKLEGGTEEERRALGAPGLVSLGFASRLLYADAFDTELDFMKRAAEAEGRPWPEVQKLGQEMEAEGSRLKNPISKIMVPGLISSTRSGRERRAQLRFVLVAARYRATGEAPDLDDPFGTKLRTSRSGDRLKVWSVGRDGVDDGGAGGWKAAAGADLVLEVDR